MKRSLLPAIAAALLSLAALQATPASAQRVFVSAQGSDANACSFAAPCRSFQHAHDTVAAGGEIDVLDPAGYGKLVINKAISIQGHGFSGISVASGTVGIDISAGATDAVNLNGLLIEGNGVGTDGIRFNTGKSLVVENCVARRMASRGLNFTPNASATLTVANSDFTGNGDVGVAIVSGSGGGAVTAAITRSAFYNNLNNGLAVVGFNGTSALNVAVSDSVAAGNVNAGGGVGVGTSTSAAHSVINLVLKRTTVSGNDIGVVAGGTGANIWLAQSSITGNATAGFNASGGGVVASYGDNTIDVNGSNSGVLGSATKQ